MSIASGTFNNIITTISSVAKNAWGDKTKTSVYSNVRCRWEDRIGRTLGPDSELRDYTIEAWIGNNYTIQYDYIFTKGGKDYYVIAMEHRYDLAGNLDHTKVFLA